MRKNYLDRREDFCPTTHRFDTASETLTGSSFNSDGSKYFFCRGSRYTGRSGSKGQNRSNRSWRNESSFEFLPLLSPSLDHIDAIEGARSVGCDHIWLAQWDRGG